MKSMLIILTLCFSMAMIAHAKDEPYPGALPSTDIVAKTAEIPVLREQALSAGKKEIRIWVGFGVFQPEKMVRIMIDGSGHISGETYLYYTPRPDTKDAGELKFFKELHKLCKVLGTSKEKEVCVPVNDAQTLWGTVYAGLMKHRVWDLPDQDTLPKTNNGIQITDGVAMLVELRNGSDYRAYYYSNPAFSDRPEAHDADEIMGALQGTGSADVIF